MANLWGGLFPFGDVEKEPVPKYADLKIIFGSLLVAGAIGLAIYDCYDAGRAADRVNRAHRRRAFLAPYVARSAVGTQYGLAFTSAF